MAKRRPLANVATEQEAISRGAIEYVNEMAARKSFGKRAMQRLAYRFPSLVQSALESIFNAAKQGRDIAQRIAKGQLQVGEQAGFMPQNPFLPKAFRYHAVAYFTRAEGEAPISVNVYIDSSKALGIKALQNRMAVFLENPGPSFRNVPQLSHISLLAAERRR